MSPPPAPPQITSLIINSWVEQIDASNGVLESLDLFYCELNCLFNCTYMLKCVPLMHICQLNIEL